MPFGSFVRGHAASFVVPPRGAVVVRWSKCLFDGMICAILLSSSATVLKLLMRLFVVAINDVLRLPGVNP